MPGLIGSQGVRPGALNMNRVFRALRYRTEQAQYITYHRQPIYKTDDYGVPSGAIGSQELLLPDLPAIIRPAVTANYQQERAGSNIIGAARIYTPNMTTIKNYPNFNQANNTNFNEIEGWDRLITNYRTIYNVPTGMPTGTSVPSTWASGSADVAFTTDGQTLTATLGATYDGTFNYVSGNSNVLEADRFRFKIKASGAVTLDNFKLYNGAAEIANTYTPAALTIPTGGYLTVDVPWITGTVASGTSIYNTGTRYATTVATATDYDYEANIYKVEFDVSGAALGNEVYLKEIEFYKSVSWHVHSLKDMTDGYIIFDCVRTSGRNDGRRRAYD